ncbi:DUF6861 domain-containing protein [Pseudomonas syringae pv. syringae]|uniref:DUF6861 domain-containing protein n=1 Tax=Pseudomonas syringae TaxID=317 RepID=UPI003AFFC315
MDLLANVPSWDDIERNLDDKFNTLNQGYSDGLQSAHDSWNGFTRRVSTAATQAFGYMGSNRIDSVKAAMRLSRDIVESDLKRKWASIEIEQILPVLLQLVKEVAMILGGSVAVGTIAGGVAGSLFFGVGAVPVAAAGAGIGLQVGNLILLTLGLASIAEYFYQGLPACLATLQEGFATAWHADEGLKPEGLDPTGGSAYVMQERIDRAARQLAKGQEQLVLLLFTAIVTYVTRGQVKAGLMGSMDSIAARSTKLQAEISNKQFANWLARNEQKLLAQPELRVNEPVILTKNENPLKKTQKSKPRKYSERADVVYRSADEVNATFPEGWSAPYKPGTRVTEFTSTVDDVYVRVHGETNMARSWMMRAEAIKGLTPAQIKSKFALPELPTFVSEVSVPAGTRIRTGTVNPVFGGIGNSTQYELLQRLPVSAFTKTTRIVQ